MYHNSVGEQDTLLMVNGTQQIKNSIHAGEWAPKASSYPLSQYLPAIIYQSVFDGSDQEIFSFLSGLNGLALAGLMGLCIWLLGPIHPVLALMGIIAILVGPLTFHAKQSFNEVHASFWIALFVVTTLKKCHPAIILSTMWMAGITKEVAFPFVFAMGVLCWNVISFKPKIWIDTKKLGALVTISGLIFMTGCAFNYLRYRTFYNSEYMGGDGMFIPWGQKFISFMAIWFSPQVGLAVIWLPAFFLIAFILITQLIEYRKSLGLNQMTFKLIGYSGIIGGLTFGFASWYSPFGWESYGQRLIIPWMPAILLMILYREQDLIISKLSILSRRPMLLNGVLGFGLIYATPHIFYFFNPQKWRQYLHADFYGLNYPSKEIIDFTVMNGITWRWDSFFIRGFNHFNPDEITGIGVSYSIIFLLGVAWIWQCFKVRSSISKR